VRISIKAYPWNQSLKVTQACGGQVKA
jgi:hypothetical protein